jgi:hypothetical protein
MLNMIIRKRSHSIVRVIIIRLVAHIQTLVACVASSGLKVLWEELALFVEIVAGALVLIC